MKKVSESGNICLSSEVVFATHMSYKKACKVLALAEKSEAVKYYNFSIHLGPNTEDLWELIGYPIEATKAFTANPEGFVITKEQIDE